MTGLFIGEGREGLNTGTEKWRHTERGEDKGPDVRGIDWSATVSGQRRPSISCSHQATKRQEVFFPRAFRGVLAK